MFRALSLIHLLHCMVLYHYQSQIVDCPIHSNPPLTAALLASNDPLRGEPITWTSNNEVTMRQPATVERKRHYLLPAAVAVCALRWARVFVTAGGQLENLRG